MAKLKPPVNKNDHVHGSPHAKIELVEYGDFQCPHCKRAHPILKKIQETLGENLRFVFRHFPISNVHEYAVPAAIASEAAARQNKFWQMHDIIFDRQSQLSEDALLDFALEIGLDISKFKKDLLDESLAEKVESDFESGMRSGVNGTPSFFINGEKHDGPFDYIFLLSALEGSSMAAS